ncbi:MAG: DUF411 domain-containing protein [Candidatus Paceibacterota bacterium]
MSKYILVGAIVALGLAGTGFLILQSSGGSAQNPNGVEVALHKSATCGCCGVWGQYMSRKGYHVVTHETNALGAIKSDLGVPREVESCHTAEIDGYVVEGHIPNEAIEKLLAEQPDIRGIGMAGMPAGSPGMPGPKTEAFVIYEITHEGSRGNVFVTL